MLHMGYNTRSRKLACKGLRLRSISRNVAAKTVRFGGELPKAVEFASKTSKLTMFVIIEEKTCLQGFTASQYFIEPRGLP